MIAHPQSDLLEATLWPQIATLTRLDAAAAFNNRSQALLFLPELFHLTTLLVGAGPLASRQTIYHLTLNTLHSLASTAEEDASRTALIAAVKRFGSDEVEQLFGLRNEPSQGLGEGISLSSLDILVKEFLVVLDTAASSQGALSPRDIASGSS